MFFMFICKSMFITSMVLTSDTLFLCVLHTFVIHSQSSTEQGGHNNRGVARNLFWGYKFLGGYETVEYQFWRHFYPIKSLLALILGGINPDIHPRRYAPA